MRTAFCILASTCLIASAAYAETFDAPQGEVILTITGDIDETNVGDTLQFDHEMLMALDQTVIETSTIWTDGVHEFQGVSLKVLAEVIGATSAALVAQAINDYSVTIPMSDATEDGPILAYFMDGTEMSIREKGPLWVVYPFDSNPEYRTEVIYSRSIWQLDRIDVVQ